MKSSKKFIAFAVLTAALFFALAAAPAATAGSKTGAAAKKSLSSQKNKLTKTAAPATAGLKGKVNINKANLDTLTQLKGIGPEKAKAILDYRKKFGSFKKIEDLMQVKGIGEKTFKAIKPFIKVK